MPYISKILTVFSASLLICLGGLAQAQTMEDILKEMAEAAKKGEQSQYSGAPNNYADELLGQSQTQQPYQPMTPQQSQQHTTDNLLRALSGASKKPQGETDDQRRQRLNNLTRDMRNENAAISQQQNDYYQARNQRLIGGSRPAGSSQGVSGSSRVSGSNDYARRREERIGTAPGGTTSRTTNPNAKPAGFGPGYAGGYTQPDPALETTTDVTTSSARRGRRTGLEAGPVIIVKDDPPPAPLTETTYCKCKGDDYPDLTGIMCNSRSGNNHYQSGYYPLTSQCFSTVTSFQGPTQE